METALPELRAFNRFYTRFSGALDGHFLGSDLPLVAVRLLWEIANHNDAGREPLANDLQQTLGLDAGYVSRMLRSFEQRGWIARGRGDDGRQRPIALTAEGRAAFADLDRRQRETVSAQLAPLGDVDRRRLIAALGTTRALLDHRADARYTVRTFETGDMGMITARQAIIYLESNGWGAGMEALLGEVTASFLRHFKPGREQCWVAESGGAMAGSIFLVNGGDGVAKLRLLYVEPWARGMGIGGDLVGRCIAFARDAGYATLQLWTHTVLTSARRIYAAHGMTIVETAIHDEFGKPEQGETWELALR